MEIMNINEELRKKLSSVQKSLYECEKDENIFEAMILLDEILSNKINEIKNNEITSLVLSKILEIFERLNNKAMICLLKIIKRYKNLFENNIYIKNHSNILVTYIIKLITCCDSIKRRCCINLISILPFLLNLELLHRLFNQYSNPFVSEDEKIEINNLFKIIIDNNFPLKKNILNFIEINKINI